MKNSWKVETDSRRFNLLLEGVIRYYILDKVKIEDEIVFICDGKRAIFLVTHVEEIGDYSRIASLKLQEWLSADTIEAIDDRWGV